MLAKKVYSLGQELEKRGRERLRKKGDLRDLFDANMRESAVAAISLSKVMARKKGQEVSLQIEIETEAQWNFLIRREGLIVVEVYAGWCGPCISMASILKKVKIDANDDRLILATANSDNIPDLRMFKGQSEPTWIFFGGGKPVKIMRGSNASKLVTTIKDEFVRELLCMEGKAKRNLISIMDEAERTHKARSEALHLATLQKIELEKEEATRKQLKEQQELSSQVVITITSAQPTPSPKERSVSPNSEMTRSERSVRERSVGPPEEPAPESADEPEDNDNNDDVLETGIIITEEDVQKAQDDAFTAAINSRLTACMEPYTVIAVQQFLLETGAVTEIKDSLNNEFQIVRERVICLDEDGARSLFGIPYEIQELIEEEEETDKSKDNDEDLQDPAESDLDTAGDAPTTKAGSDITSATGEDEDNQEVEAIVQPPVTPKYRTVPVTLPDELAGDTLVFLLENLEVAKQKKEDPEATFAKTADDLLGYLVGPVSYQEAVNNEPKSLLALYGREEYAVGVWCPRKYEEKKLVMLNYFPQFVMELLTPPPKEQPKYMLAIFPSLFSNEIMENPELLTHQSHVVAQGKVELSSKLVDRMLKSRGLLGGDLEAQKKALTGFGMFAVSVDGRNAALNDAIQALEPIHYSVDSDNGKFETAKLFPSLNILIDNDYDDDIYKRDLIIDKFLSRPKLFKLEALFDYEEESGPVHESSPIPTPTKEDHPPEGHNDLVVGVIDGGAAQDTSA